MRPLRIAATLALAWVLGSGALAAFAQYGLTGAPEMLNLSALQPLPPVASQSYAVSPQGSVPGLLPENDSQPARPVWAAAGRVPAVWSDPQVSVGPAPVVGQQPGYGAPVAWATPSAGTPLPAPPPTAAAESATQWGQPQTAPSQTNVVDQMLREAAVPDPGYAADPGCPSSRCDDAWATYGSPRWGHRTWLGQAVGCGCGNALGDGACATGCYQPLWYVRGLGLIMTRDLGNRVWFTYETNNNSNQLMNSQDTGEQWRGGAEIRFGRYFGCGQWAVEAAYWSIANFDTSASQTHPNGVSTPLSFFDVVYQNVTVPGDPVDLFDGAEEHRLWRENELHNVEVNLVHLPTAGILAERFQCDWFAGVRFFRFTENLTFGSLGQGAPGWGVDLANEGYLADRVENNLVGSQVGCHLHYQLAPRWVITVSPAVGIYGNYIEHRFEAYRGDGELFDTVPASYPGYPVRSNTGAISFLSQVDVGVEWLLSERWTATIGYRVIAATGMALADHQIPPFVVDTPELADIDHNGHLLLHGGYAGITAQF